jgi:hypothetical protein
MAEKQSANETGYSNTLQERENIWFGFAGGANTVQRKDDIYRNKLFLMLRSTVGLPVC